MRHIDYDRYADELENNWARWDSFGLADRETFIGRCIVYTRGRDSKLLQRCNAEAIARNMHAYVDGVQCDTFEASHWACGWVAGYWIQVRDTQGEYTPAFKEWCAIQAALEDYPVLDDEAYSQAVYERACEICAENDWDASDDADYDRACTWANEE